MMHLYLNGSVLFIHKMTFDRKLSGWYAFLFGLQNCWHSANGLQKLLAWIFMSNWISLLPTVTETGSFVLLLLCSGQVANKLYQLNYISQNIEQFATNMLLSVVEQHASDIKPSQSVSTDQREGEVWNIYFFWHIHILFIEVNAILNVETSLILWGVWRDMNVVFCFYWAFKCELYTLTGWMDYSSRLKACTMIRGI